MATLILTAVGNDRPGLVSDLSAPINAHGASCAEALRSMLEGLADELMVEIRLSDD